MLWPFTEELVRRLVVDRDFANSPLSPVAQRLLAIAVLVFFVDPDKAPLHEWAKAVQHLELDRRH